MGTKITSIRIDKDLLKEIDSTCTKNECNRNDWIKLAISNQLELESSEDDDVDDEHKSHHDSHGNYWTWNKDRKIWTCHMNMENVRVEN